MVSFISSKWNLRMFIIKDWYSRLHHYIFEISIFENRTFKHNDEYIVSAVVSISTRPDFFVRACVAALLNGTKQPSATAKNWLGAHHTHAQMHNAHRNPNARTQLHSMCSYITYIYTYIHTSKCAKSDGDSERHIYSILYAIIVCTEYSSYMYICSVCVYEHCVLYDDRGKRVSHSRYMCNKMWRCTRDDGVFKCVHVCMYVCMYLHTLPIYFHFQWKTNATKMSMSLLQSVCNTFRVLPPLKTPFGQECSSIYSV